jgi:hypothetical protein
MMLLEMLVMLVAAAAVLGYVCRLDALQFTRHKLRVILLHVALMACAGGAGFSAYSQALGLQDVAGLGAAIIWLWVSLPTWRHGPPSHVTKAAPMAQRSRVWREP